MIKSGYRDNFAREHLPDEGTWPVFVFSKDLPPYSDYLNTGEELLSCAINKGYGNNVAVRMGDIVWTYNDLNKVSNKIAATLSHDYKLVPGNRVLLRGNNTPMLMALWYGVLKAGGIVVTTMTMLRQKELDQIINMAQVDIIIIEEGLAIDLLQACEGKVKHVISYGKDSSKLDQVLRQKRGHFDAVKTASDDVAMLAFTSGTTGLPKATMHFHRDIMAMADSFARHILKPIPEDVFCGSPPLAFTFGLGGLLVFPARFGASVVYFDGSGPDMLLDIVERYRVTALFTAPTAYKAISAKLEGRNISSLRICVSAGENLPLSVSDQFFNKTGIRLIDGIGATEMIHVFISASGSDIKPGATGKVVPGYEAEIWDEHNQPLPYGKEGKLVVRGPTGCRYLNGDRQETYVVNGWNVTGDIFKKDADGYFWFVARGDDMIISAGYNIAAPEVEQAIMGHDAVSECAVIGVPDEDRGNLVKAFIVLKNGVEKSENLSHDIQKYVKETVAPYKYPRIIEFVDGLPKSATGKLLRKELRK